MKLNDKVIKIEFNLKVLLIIVAVIFLIFLGYKATTVFVILFLSFMLTSAVLPLYRRLLKKDISSTLSIVIIYFSFIVLFIALLALIVIPSLSDFEKLINDLPEIVTQISEGLSRISLPFVEVEADFVEKALQGYAKELSANLVPNLLRGLEGVRETLKAVANVLGLFFTVITVFILSIYEVTEHDELIELYLLRFFDEKYHKRIKELILKLENKLGKWFAGQGLLMLIIGILTWVGLVIIGVPFALPLAVIAGLLEVVPNLGPVLSAIPGVLLALIDGGSLQFVLTGAWYILIQQVENSIIVPRVMGNAVGLRPIFVLVGMLFGFAIGGILGAFLTIPILVVLKVFWEFLQEIKAFQ